MLDTILADLFFGVIFYFFYLGRLFAPGRLS